ncbi:hypothetical protein B0H67DRAFT_649637 [Lasiosphaeris hirsuta]|uniref:Uncharacterized protein n=1 Tax=Lasiosphaeris hirsuta TaxID=260670 RepID=A0AA40DJC0_9PEZI|nr:hypothetical protein B0H67DRAFT_649637 [Lasiosphaeris hirsuta]
MPPKRKVKDAFSFEPPGPLSHGRPAGVPKVVPPTITLSDDEFQPTTKRPAKRARKPQPQPHAKQPEEDLELRPGRAAVPNGEAPEDTVYDRKKAHEALTWHKQNLDKAYVAQQKQLADFFGSFKAASAATSTSSKEANSLFLGTRLLIRQCRAVLKRHQEVDKDVREPRQTPLREAWRKDEMETRQLLQYGLEYGKRLAE